MRSLQVAVELAYMAGATQIVVITDGEEIGLRPDHVPRPPDLSTPEKRREFLQSVEPTSLYRIVDGPRSPRETLALGRPRRRKKR